MKLSSIGRIANLPPFWYNAIIAAQETIKKMIENISVEVQAEKEVI
jgi:hypothetical protein